VITHSRPGHVFPKSDRQESTERSGLPGRPVESNARCSTWPLDDERWLALTNTGRRGLASFSRSWKSPPRQFGLSSNQPTAILQAASTRRALRHGRFVKVVRHEQLKMAPSPPTTAPTPATPPRQTASNPAEHGAGRGQLRNPDPRGPRTIRLQESARLPECPSPSRQAQAQPSPPQNGQAPPRAPPAAFRDKSPASTRR